MNSSSLLNFDALIAPFPENHPAGIPVPFAIRHQLEEARKENDTVPQQADWPGIVQLAQETLARTSKDLVVAARLTEGLVKLHGFAGLRDGLHLLCLLVDQCWERLYPSMDDGDLEVRAAPFNWLDDPDRGARFPTTLRLVPFLGPGGCRYGWLDWHQAQNLSGPIIRDAVDHVLQETPLEALRRVGDDLAASMEELDRLCLSLAMRLGSVAPSLIHLRRALKDCHGVIHQIHQRKGTPPTSVEAGLDPTFPTAEPDVKTTLVVRELLMQVKQKSRFRERQNKTVDYGPLEDLADDWRISTILVNGPSQVFVEERGELILTDPRYFRDAAHLRQFIDQLASQAGRRVDSPLIHFRLPDGARVYAVLPPVAADGPVLTLEFFGHCILRMDNLVATKALTPEMALFLKAAVKGRLNILICGGPGSGKTTLLNVLAGFIPARERVLTIEDALQLDLSRDHLVCLEIPPASHAGSAPITARDLLRYALAMMPDRILRDDCRGDEVFDLLHAMRTIQGGSMTTLQVHTPAEARSHLENLVATVYPNMPPPVIRWHLMAAVDLIVQLNRLGGHVRKVTHITEVLGQTDEGIRMADLFRYTQRGFAKGRPLGQFEATGFPSTFVPHLEARGIKLPDNLFEKRILQRH
jgi:pilus assembly protein CpaF